MTTQPKQTAPPSDPAACCPPESPRALDRLGAPVEDQAADEELAMFAKALGHPVRIRILRMLASQDPRMCRHIVDELPLAQSTVSEHLRILRTAGLVQVNDSGPRAGYCLVPSAVTRFKALLNAL
jgi:ArsR family transcriptional regulator, arsenate/arsenite/antimonite-responsive transcriptional repressor